MKKSLNRKWKGGKIRKGLNRAKLRNIFELKKLLKAVTIYDMYVSIFLILKGGQYRITKCGYLWNSRLVHHVKIYLTIQTSSSWETQD